MKINLFQDKATGEQKEKQKRLLYIIFVIGLVIAYARYIPYFQDYYVAKPVDSLLTFLNQNYLNGIYGFEAILIGTLLVIVYLLSWNIGISLLLVSIPVFALTHASFLKYANRRELFRLDDLKLTEAAGMATKYVTFTLDKYSLILIISMFVLVVFGFLTEHYYGKNFKAGWKEKSQKAKWSFRVIRIGSALFCFCLLFFYYKGYMEYRKSPEVVEHLDVLNTESQYYVLYRFLENDKLANISVDNIDASYAFFEENATNDYPKSDVNPSVIVIMNESWWNTDNFGEGTVTFNTDPMAPYRELAEKCSTGFLTSNVYGGGTVSSEAEFLTGLNTKYFMGDSDAFIKLEGLTYTGVTGYFKELGYGTVAMHPYTGEFYNRQGLYSQFGFEKLLFADDMTYQELYSKYISDSSVMKQIIKEYQEKETDSMFLWAVTIANHRRHLPFRGLDELDVDFPVTATVNGVELSDAYQEEIDNYVSGIYYSCLAFQELVEYFETVDEPVILAMYGDHIPNFRPEYMEYLGFSHEATDTETLERTYSVPVIMWTNMKEETIEFQGENISYLPQMIMEYAGLPNSYMGNVLAYERSLLKTNTRYLLRDEEGELLESFSDAQIEAVNHFKSLQYDVLYGKNEHSNLWSVINSN